MSSRGSSTQGFSTTLCTMFRLFSPKSIFDTAQSRHLSSSCKRHICSMTVLLPLSRKLLDPRQPLPLPFAAQLAKLGRMALPTLPKTRLPLPHNPPFPAPCPWH